MATDFPATDVPAAVFLAAVFLAGAFLAADFLVAALLAGARSAPVTLARAAVWPARTAWAAARRAMGTRNGEQLT